MVANHSIVPKLLAEWLAENSIFVCVSSLRSLAQTINAVETGNNKILIQPSMQVTSRKTWCILRDRQVEQAVAPYKFSTPATWQVQCPQNKGCKKFENLKLLIIKPLSLCIYTTRMKAALKMASYIHILHSTATLKTLLNVKQVCGYREGVREVLEAQWQVTNQEL